MVKCPQCSHSMTASLTRKGVLIDICPSCSGVWLDPGEIWFFVSKKYRRNTDPVLEKTQKSPHKCPLCSSAMGTGKMPTLGLHVEQCLSCRGLYLNQKEFQKIQKNFKGLKTDRSQPTSPFSVKIPSLAFTSTCVVLSLYGLLFGIIVLCMEIFQLPWTSGLMVYAGFILLQFWLSPFIMDLQLKWIGSLDWVPLEKLPPHFQKSLRRLCRICRIPIPRIGIIRDGSPGAYTYGRTPYSARVVLSEGMFELLDEDEVSAVVAHELGHIKNWDFVLMTAVQIVPMILYRIYQTVKSLMRSKSKSSKGKGALLPALIVSYLAYRISQYLILFLSRVREYYADRVSCLAFKKPNKLITALVKISYGLLDNSRRKEASTSRAESSAALNIMNISRSKQLDLINSKEENFAQSIQSSMQWDLWNPWAFYYELNSTHPLTAKRIHAIGSYASKMGQKPYIEFKRKKPESYWDDFFVDLFVLLLPFTAGLCGFLVSLFFIFKIPLWSAETWETLKLGGLHLWPSLLPSGGMALACFSLGALLKNLLTYPGEGKFFPCRISSLLKVVKVSPVRSYPVTLKGTIIGRGQAGQILSEDFYLKDSTGIIFLNHEPFGINAWFALRHFNKYKGKKAVVTGWLRRSPTPYLEVREIKTEETRSKSYIYNYKIIFSILGAAMGFWLFSF